MTRSQTIDTDTLLLSGCPNRPDGQRTHSAWREEECHRSWFPAQMNVSSKAARAASMAVRKVVGFDAMSPGMSRTEKARPFLACACAHHCLNLIRFGCGWDGWG